MKKTLFIIGLVLLATHCFSQFEAAYEEKCFAWKVKQIDEFMERFNNEPQTQIRQYVETHDRAFKLDREKLLLSLFDRKQHPNIAVIKNFIRDVDNQEHPQYLDFFNSHWCAQIDCGVNWRGHKEKVTLTLKVRKLSSSRSEWVIADAKADFLQHVALQDSLPKIAADSLSFATQNQQDFLDPYCHATDFMELALISPDQKNFDNYFSFSDHADATDLSFFVHEMINKRLSIISTDPFSIRYYFNSVKGWIFEVKEFNRESINSGWLITKLARSNEKI